MPKSNKMNGGQTNAFYNFLSSFGASPTNSSQDIQNKFKSKLEDDFQNNTTNQQVIRGKLETYVNYIIQATQDLEQKKTQLNQAQSNLNSQKQLELQYRQLVKKTDQLLRDFDKYLLQYMSFIRNNPKRKLVLVNLSDKIGEILQEFNYNNSINSNNQNLTDKINQKAFQDQNKIMISVIQSILESTRPIYQNVKTPSNINKNVSNNKSKNILDEINKSRKMSGKLQKAFDDNISNFIQLLTRVVELNTTVISFANNKMMGNKLQEFYQDYQNNIQKLIKLINETVSNNVNSFGELISENKKKNDVFVQELVSEVFRWGLNTFKIYKHNQITGVPMESKN